MKFLHIGIIVLVMGPLLKADGCSMTGWKAVGDSCFWFELDTRMTYEHAQRSCMRKGSNSYLASCLTDAEVDFITTYLNQNGNPTYYFIGDVRQNRWGIMSNADQTNITSKIIYRSTNATDEEVYRCIAFYPNFGYYYRWCRSTYNYVCKRGQSSCGPKYMCPLEWSQDTNKCYLVVDLRVVNFSESFLDRPTTFGNVVAFCNYAYGRVVEPDYDNEWKYIRMRLFKEHRGAEFWSAMPNLTTSFWCSDPVVNQQSARKAIILGQTNPQNDFCWKMCDNCSASEQHSFICEKSIIASENIIDGSCKNGWFPIGESCFYFEDRQKLSASDAETTCRTMNSHLASCFSPFLELPFLLNHIYWYYKNSTPFFIGINQQNFDHITRNLNGSELIDFILPNSIYQPIQNSDRQCFTISNNFKVSNYYCNFKAHYICKTGPTSCGTKFICPLGWELYVDRCYFAYDGKLTFQEAYDYCYERASTLLEINSEDESFYIKSAINGLFYLGQNQNADYWLGTNSTEKWTSSGNPINYKDWCPDMYVTKMDGEILSGYGMTKANQNHCWTLCKDCATKSNAFFCEISALVTLEPNIA